MPRNDTLFLVDAKEARNTFLYAPATKQNGNAFLYTCYGTNGPAMMSDPDALAYATAGNVLDTPERLALNRLVLSLKSNGLWDKIHAVYPMTPSTTSSATSYALNLKNTAQHQLAIPTSFACTAEGLRNNAGTTEQCSSTLNWDTVSIENMSMGIYYRTYGANDASQVDIAIATAGTQAYMQTRSLSGVNQLVGEAGYQNWVGSDAVSGLAGAPGLHVLARLNGQTNYFVNANALNTQTGSIVTQPVSGIFSLGNKATAPISFAFVSENLTQTELGTLQSIVDTYQSSLTVPRNFTGIIGPIETRNFTQAAQLKRWRHVEIVNDLVIALQAANLWPLITLLYPFVGGTAAAHSINLKNPLSNTITWGGQVSHTALGTKSTGATGQGMIGALLARPKYMGLFVTESAGPAQSRDFGDFSNLPQEWIGVTYQWFNGVHYFDAQPDISLTATSSDATGYKAFSIIDGGKLRTMTTYIGGSQASVVSTATAGSTSLPQKITLFRGNPQSAVLRTHGLAVAAASLTTPQHAALYNAIQVFQIALGRAV